MFSSSTINTAAAGSSNPAHYHHHQLQHLQFSDHNSSIRGKLLQHHTNGLVAGMVAQDAHESVPIGSAITFISPVGNTTSMDKPRSVSRVTKKKSDTRSKIKTAQGLRDRRVRLSIGVARRFFDLQDLLGFDKPSKTVEWLLTKSNKAIMGLSAASPPSVSSEAAGTQDGFKSLTSSRSTATCSTNQVQQVSSDDPLKAVKRKAELLARESREKARARARARTLAKLHHKKISLLENPLVKNGDQERLCFSKSLNNFSSPSLLKASYIVEGQEEKRHGEVRAKHKQQHQLHSYGPNPCLSLDWDIGSVIPHSSYPATHRLNLSRDVEIYTRSSWDQLLNNYRTL